MTNQKEALKEMLVLVQGQLNAIEDEERKANNQEYVGKYYKCSNSYGDGEKWWMYSRPYAIDEDGFLHVMAFQQTSNGTIEIRTADLVIGISLFEEEITKDEFDLAWAIVLNNARTAKELGNKAG